MTPIPTPEERSAWLADQAARIAEINASAIMDLAAVAPGDDVDSGVLKARRRAAVSAIHAEPVPWAERARARDEFIAAKEETYRKVKRESQAAVRAAYRYLIQPPPPMPTPAELRLFNAKKSLRLATLMVDMSRDLSAEMANNGPTSIGVFAILVRTEARRLAIMAEMWTPPMPTPDRRQDSHPNGFNRPGELEARIAELEAMLTAKGIALPEDKEE